MFVVEAARGDREAHTRSQTQGRKLVSAGCGKPGPPFRPQEPPPAGATGVGVCVRVLSSLSIVPTATAIVMFLYADVP